LDTNGISPEPRTATGADDKAAGLVQRVRRRMTPSANALRQVWSLLGQHHRLIIEMTRRELRDRYAGQVLGATWAIGHPLFLMALYVFLFAFVFPGRIAELGGTSRGMVTYVLSGLVPWLAFSDGMTRGTEAIIGEGRLVKQVVFPVEVLPIKIALVAFVSQLVTTPILLVVILLADGAIPVTSLLLLPLMVLQLMAMVGLNFALSALTVYFRDLREFVRIFVTAGLFLAPILYRPEWIDHVFAPFALVLQINPFSHLVWCYQDALFYGHIVHPVSWLVVVLLSFAALASGYRLFRRLQPLFGDML
jgi:lipopolysaccharide transport system permease protein